MATLREIENTREALYGLRKEYRQHGSRVHDETKVVWDAMEDALKHPVCRDCVNLIPHVTTGTSPTGKKVSLECLAGLDPVKHWLGTFAGDADNVTCGTFKQINVPALQPQE